VVDLGGKTSMAGLIELMRNAALVVSNDTGPGHIAAAMGRPVVFVFGPTNPARVHPYGRPECVVAANAFGRGDLADNPEPEYAIERIRVDEVKSRIKEVLGTENSTAIGSR
jgi:ADP-heptose:LPS heptosyltransferase